MKELGEAILFWILFQFVMISLIINTIDTLTCKEYIEEHESGILNVLPITKTFLDGNKSYQNIVLKCNNK